MRSLSKIAMASILAIASMSSSATVALNDGLLAWYQFNGTTVDSSVNHNDGVSYGNMSFTDGVFGQAAVFDETFCTYMLTSKDMPLNSNSYAISTWFNVSEFEGSWEILISRMTDSYVPTKDSWDLALSDTESMYFWNSPKNQDERAVVGNNTVTLSDWHNTIVNVNDGVGAMYLDGIPVATFSQTGTFTADSNMSVCIGCNDYNVGYSKHYLNGALDDVRVYNRGLNIEEIAALSTSSVPEPGTILMVIAGLSIMIAMADKRTEKEKVQPTISRVFKTPPK